MAQRRNILKDMKVKIRLKEGKGDMPLSRLRLSDLEAFVDENSVRAINEDFDGLHKNVTNENLKQGIDPTKIRNNRFNNVVIATDETVIAHSMGVIPYDFRVVMKGTGGWYQTRDPDTQNIYIAVAAGTDSVTADIIVEG
jgi:hypothetical protein